MKEKSSKITIAIDGYSSTGKSTVAKQIAKALGYVYVDTGAMYRAVTYYALQNGLFAQDKLNREKLIASLQHIHLKFIFNAEKGFGEMYLNGLNIENEIRSMYVSNHVSEVATVKEVRSYLVKLQREMGKDKGVIMDGRDIGSVVFPDAELKVFLTADAKIRAERRWLELTQKGENPNLDEIYQNVVERDHIDSSREESPLTKTSDAIAIDVTHINKEQQFQKIYELAMERIQNKKATQG